MLKMEVRTKWIEELSEVIGRADDFLNEVCENYQWNIKELEKLAEENYMVCPFVQSHVVPERSMHKHLESCEWRTLGYTKDCKPLPESAIPTTSPFSIKFDMELQFKVLQEAKQKDPQLEIGSNEKLIPQTSDRLTSDFTRDERKAMYEYVVANTLAPDVGQDITDLNKPDEKEERSASLLELLAQERNLKRRKTKYRGVHTNKKSYNEIMREVVQQQMEMYKEYLVEKFGVEILGKNQENSSNNVKDEKHSSSHSEYSMSNHKSRDTSRDSHRDHSASYRENSKYQSSDSYRSHSRDYRDNSRQSYNHHNRDYNKSSRYSSQYDGDYKSHSNDFSRRYDHHNKDENDYKFRDRNEYKHQSHKYSEKSKADDTKEHRDKSKSSRDWYHEYTHKDRGNNMNNYDENQHDSRDRKRDRSKSVEKKYESKSRDDTNSKKHENHSSHKKKKHKSDREEKNHKKSKHKHKGRSRSRS